MELQLFHYTYPVLYVSRLFALSHFSIESKKLSIFLLLYSILLIVSLNSLAIYQVNFEISAENSSKLYKFVVSLRILSLVISTNCICLVFILKYKTIVEFLCCVCRVETIIKDRLKVALSKALYVKFQVIVIAVIALAVGVRVFLTYILEGFTASFLNLFSMVSYLSQAQFVCCVLLLNQYLSIINNKLLHLKESKNVLIFGNKLFASGIDQGFLNFGKHHQDEEHVDDVIGICNELVRYISVIKDNLNSYFSFPILLVLADNLLLTTFNLYMLIKHFSFTSDTTEIIQLGSYFYVVVVNIVQVIYLAFPCAVADHLVHSMAEITHMNINRHRSIVSGLLVLSKQLLHIDMSYTACGFFILNESLLTSVFGAISTQLVILLQFGTQEDVK